MESRELDCKILLTGIALELLGNSFFDINGVRCTDFENLHQMRSESRNYEHTNLKTVLGLTDDDLIPRPAEDKKSVLNKDETSSVKSLAAEVCEHDDVDEHKTMVDLDELFLSKDWQARQKYIEIKMKREIDTLQDDYDKNLQLFLHNSTTKSNRESIESTYKRLTCNRLEIEQMALIHFIEEIKKDNTSNCDLLSKIAADILTADSILFKKTI